MLCDLLEAVGTVPLVSVVGIWSLGQVDTRKVEPLVFTVGRLTSHHVSVADVLAVAVDLFNLIAYRTSSPTLLLPLSVTCFVLS